MSHEHMQLLKTRLGVHVVDADSVVKPSHHQLTTHNVSSVYWNLVSSYLLLVPEQHHLVFVPSHQDRTQHQTHSH